MVALMVMADLKLKNHCQAWGFWCRGFSSPRYSAYPSPCEYLLPPRTLLGSGVASLFL